MVDMWLGMNFFAKSSACVLQERVYLARGDPDRLGLQVGRADAVTQTLELKLAKCDTLLLSFLFLYASLCRVLCPRNSHPSSLQGMALFRSRFSKICTLEKVSTPLTCCFHLHLLTHTRRVGYLGS